MATAATSPAGFVGSGTCAGCHAREYADWRGSHHARAMQLPQPDTVLGNFSGVSLDHFGATTRFFERDGVYLVETTDAEGSLREFPVKYTFGLAPLQQYLVEYGGGRLQALPFAWDSRPLADGGQRWFHLYPDEEVPPRDALHWTGREHNWNYMCAECHSTDVDLGYDPARDRFDTSYAEISVGCEACHGPGSAHVAQAHDGVFDSAFGLPVDLDDLGDAAWQMDAATGIARRSALPDTLQQQPESCGRCHARRGVVAPDYEFARALTATHMPALLEEGLYFPDGQILDEVYVYGSFLQSRMYRAGVTCSDCHNPHSAALVTGAEPSDVCAQCHEPATFAVAAHHRHEPDAVRCVDCHMLERTYMVVDERRDHSFRVPRPGLSAALGTPNACTHCHRDRDAAWAAAMLSEWYGGSVSARPEFATALAAGRAGRANQALRATLHDDALPGIARATALTLLADPLGLEDLRAVAAGLADEDPLLRIAALRALQRLPVEVRPQFGSATLADPMRAVRLEAALAYAAAADLLSASARPALRRAIEEFRETWQHLAFRPEAQVQLGELARSQGDNDAAIAHYRRALAMQPGDTLVRANLADLHRAVHDEAAAEALLRDGLDLEPDNAMLLHSLGLLLARTDRLAQGIEMLRAAAESAPDSPRFVYVLAVALNSAGQADAAIALLRGARERFTHDFDIGWALATMLRDRGRPGDRAHAAAIANKLLVSYPDDPRVKQLREALRDGG